jgi:hypothetical protein
MLRGASPPAEREILVFLLAIVVMGGTGSRRSFEGLFRSDFPRDLQVVLQAMFFRSSLSAATFLSYCHLAVDQDCRRAAAPGVSSMPLFPTSRLECQIGGPTSSSWCAPSFPVQVVLSPSPKGMSML